MMRPFTTNDFTNEKEMWGGPFQNKRKIEIGQPFAQEYGIGTRWLFKVDMEKIAPKDELPSPVKKVTAGGARAYQVGPPYIMKGFDLWRLVNKWVDFNPYVYDQVSKILCI